MPICLFDFWRLYSGSHAYEASMQAKLWLHTQCIFMTCLLGVGVHAM